MSKHLFIPAALAACLLASCATPNKVYKEFYGEQKYKAISVNADASSLQDGKGDKENLLSDRSKALLKTVLNTTMQQLSQKGYSPQSDYQSIGLALPDSTHVFVTNNPEQYEGNIITTPHYVKKDGTTPSKVRQLMADRLYSQVFSHKTLSKKLKMVEFHEVNKLGIPKGQYILFVHGFSRNVNVSKQIGQATLMAVASMGTLVMWEPDVAFAQIAIIDPDTHKVVWANSGNIGRNIEKDIAKIIEPLPRYGSKQ